MHHLGRLVSIAISYALLVAILERIFKGLARFYLSRLQRKNQKLPVAPASAVSPIEEITPLHGFNYKDVEPIKYRPFENKRHVTMGESAYHLLNP